MMHASASGLGISEAPRNHDLDDLLAKLSEQQVLLSRQNTAIQAQRGGGGSPDSTGSAALTNPYTVTSRSEEVAEMLRLKQALETANNKIASMDQELSQTRITKHTLEQAMGSQFDSDFDHIRDLRPQGVVARVDNWVQSTEPGHASIHVNPQTANNTSLAPPAAHGIWGSGSASPGVIGQLPTGGNNWALGDPRVMASARLEADSANLFPVNGTNPRGCPPALRLDTSALSPYLSEPSSGALHSRPPSAFGNHLHPWGAFNPNFNGTDHSNLTSPMTPHSFQSAQNMHTASGMPLALSDQVMMNNMNNMNANMNANMHSNMNANMNNSMTHHMNSSMGNLNTHMSNMPFGPRSVGTRLSPTATEFQAGTYGNPGWNGGQQVSAIFTLSHHKHTDHLQAISEPGAYLTSGEPMNYRRLLDRSMSCNWKYIVDKIVHSNDQQASIFLQQKLKVGTQEQKYEIVQSIIDQAYALMINRFGNFLVQRCFEHGTPEQIIAIARAIRGNTLNLSMDPFGCHVVQKAFDSVPEDYKAIMVHELLCRIPETVIHRYACHVWQKLFELRWNGTPPQIMKYVNDALHGMWHEVALGETGSLVVQNIFENCLEDDKRPCINEVLVSIDVIAHGQFGNWCIQHICEHGAIPDRSHAIDHVLRYATEYSMDQFASKVVEKCLKIGGSDFLDRYLDRVCEAHADRPRMPLIDSESCMLLDHDCTMLTCETVSGDQFGNYLIQYILTHADPQRREVVATHIRKHMVSLRGSKYGSRVAMLCSNPAVATRPGPPTGILMGRNAGNYGERSFSGHRGFPYGGAYR
jgi:HEPN domain-containing protein